MTLSQLLIDYRTEHQYSQRTFAALCGLSNSYISILEKNINPKTGGPIVPNLHSLNKIASAMGLTIEELFAACDDMPVDISNPDINEKAAPEKQVQPLVLSDAQAELVRMMEQLTPDEQKMLLRMARAAFSAPPED